MLMKRSLIVLVSLADYDEAVQNCFTLLEGTRTLERLRLVWFDNDFGVQSLPWKDAQGQGLTFWVLREQFRDLRARVIDKHRGDIGRLDLRDFADPFREEHIRRIRHLRGTNLDVELATHE